MAADERRGPMMERGIVAVVEALLGGLEDGNRDVVQECVAPSVAIDMDAIGFAAPKHVTAERFIDEWIPSLDPILPPEYRAQHRRVRFDGVEATVVYDVILFHYRRPRSGRRHGPFNGRYGFHLVDLGGRWAVDRVRLEVCFESEFLTISGEASPSRRKDRFPPPSSNNRSGAASRAAVAVARTRARTQPS
jgi:hypothetical protein